MCAYDDGGHHDDPDDDDSDTDEAFLAGRIGFMEIPHIIESVLSSSALDTVESIAQLVAVDAEARSCARQHLVQCVQ